MDTKKLWDSLFEIPPCYGHRNENLDVFCLYCPFDTNDECGVKTQENLK